MAAEITILYRADMLALPGDLARSTLGDILGCLHRESASGSLLLTEWRSGALDHAIHWHDGLIHGVDSATSVTSLSTLIERQTRHRTEGHSGAGKLSSAARLAFRWALESAQRTQRLERLESLFGLRDAKLKFGVAGGATRVRTGSPLRPSDFLHGRPRLRDDQRIESARFVETEHDERFETSQRDSDLTTLGLPLGATSEEIRASFRQSARRWHPDRHPDASETTLAALSRRFARLSSAYQRLTTQP